MPAKKGKGKKGAGSQAKAEESRLAQLRLREAEAEEFQRYETERRQREEQDERISLVREEQLRLLREKEQRITELDRKVSEVTSVLKDDRLGYEGQIEQLSTLRDALFNEVSLLKAENEEQRQLLTHERQNFREQERVLRTEIETVKITAGQEKSQFREQLASTLHHLEEAHREVDSVTESKMLQERENEKTICNLRDELEKALTMNRALQMAVESREADDMKNMTLMQLLNSQLDESKRQYEEQLMDERLRTQRAKDEVTQLESRCGHLQEKLDMMKVEWNDARQRTDNELRQYKEQFEQVTFDAEYLRKELTELRQENSDLQRQLDTVKAIEETESKRHEVEEEMLQKKVKDMEALLYDKEREYADKITFMNAQVMNNRTAIGQMQKKLIEERAAHEGELERRTIDVQQVTQQLNTVTEAETKERKEHMVAEEKLRNEVDELKSSVLQLRSALAEKERSKESLRVLKDEEIRRLCDILDSHFIPHRQDVEVSRCSVQTDQLAMLRDKLQAMTIELKMKEAAFSETEMHLRQQLAAQRDVIETLQQEVRKEELRRHEEARFYADEIARLKKTLELHFISCAT